MSIFKNLMSKIFGHGEDVAAVAPAAPTAAKVAPTANVNVTAPAAATAVVDVEAVLEGLAAKSTQKLNWRMSIVDLMKLVGMDSSLAQRKELAQELGYAGSLQDSAAMNVWLHKQVLRKLADNGGKIPADLLD